MGEKNSTSLIQETVRLTQLMQNLEQIPVWSREGFFHIGDQMNHISESFATNSSRALTIRERIGTADGLGVLSLDQDLHTVCHDMKMALSDIGTLIGQKDDWINRLEQVIQWSLSLEQEATLPASVDQLRSVGSERLERQTLCAMLDNLMQQVRPLIHETTTTCQLSEEAVGALARTIRTDLSVSHQRLDSFHDGNQATIDHLSASVANVDTTCQKIIEHADQVAQILFAMIQAMQYDDITAQRIQHSISALSQACDRLSSSKKTQENRRWSVLAMRIVVDQLKQTGQDMGAAIATIQGYLDTIIELSRQQRELVSSARGACRAFHQQLDATAWQLQSMLQVGLFSDTLSSQVIQSLSLAEHGLFQTRRALDMLAMTAERLTKLARTLKTDGNHRLAALDSMIDGLAARIHTESRQQQGEIQQAIDQLHTISMTYADSTTPKMMRTNGMLRRLPLSTRQMDMVNNDHLRLFNDVLADTQFTVAQVRLLSSDLVFHDRIRDTIAATVAVLEEIIQNVGKNLGEYMTSNPYELASEFEDLSQMYTMDSERRLHQATLGGGEEPAAAQEDDIELF
ncbi:MAG: hypothetical protein HQL60_02740 [Magnetococcales bacterium]|nr:hypothetical protein [Magnetococcales bacterium]